MLSFFKTSGNSEIVKTSVVFTFLECGRDGDFSVDVDTRSPKGVVDMDIGKRHLFNRSIRSLIFLFAGAGYHSCHQGSTNQDNLDLIHMGKG